MEKYLLLGIIQGITEFLPISSSAHLVFAQALLGVNPPGVALEGVLHLGTLLAVLVYFRRDILALLSRIARGDPGGLRYFALLVVATVPIILSGLLLKGYIESAFSSAAIAGGFLLVTGGLLLLADYRLDTGGDYSLNLPRALGIGGAQALALLPGISRSGATIAAGLIFGLEIEEAVRFSFLLAIPAIAGGSLLSLSGAQGADLRTEELLGIALGGTMAFLSGLLAIKFLLSLLGRKKLWPFALYCLTVGTLALIFLR
jgi:undecaprenyl-diphosphatase